MTKYLSAALAAFNRSPFNRLSTLLIVFSTSLPFAAAAAIIQWSPK